MPRDVSACRTLASRSLRVPLDVASLALPLPLRDVITLIDKPEAFTYSWLGLRSASRQAPAKA